jgi:hypothetical protein
MSDEMESPEEKAAVLRAQPCETYSDGMLTECTGDPLLKTGTREDVAASMNASSGNRRLPPR